MRSLLRSALARLTTRQMMVLAGVLLAADLGIPDPIPFADELLLGVAVLLLARRRQLAAVQNRPSPET
jgi:hypothetical protein